MVRSRSIAFNAGRTPKSSSMDWNIIPKVRIRFCLQQKSVLNTFLVFGKLFLNVDSEHLIIDLLYTAGMTTEILQTGIKLGLLNILALVMVYLKNPTSSVRLPTPAIQFADNCSIVLEDLTIPKFKDP